jgi:hypothetical protein
MKKKFLLSLFSLLIFTQSCDSDEDPPQDDSHAIGDFHEGGVIFYLDETGEHGFVASVSDLGFDKVWGCPTLINFGAIGLEIGTGAQNTIDIVTACSDTNSAATLSSQLVQNSFEDWFLPSKDELDLLYQQQTIINETALKNNGGSFSNGGRYWSSSHDLDNTAWVEYFNTGQQDGVLKDAKHYVRAIRSF